MRSQRATAVNLPVPGGELRNRMREILTSGSVGGGGGNPGSYPELGDLPAFRFAPLRHLASECQYVIFILEE